MAWIHTADTPTAFESGGNSLNTNDWEASLYILGVFIYIFCVINFHVKQLGWMSSKLELPLHFGTTCLKFGTGTEEWRTAMQGYSPLDAPF